MTSITWKWDREDANSDNIQSGASGAMTGWRRWCTVTEKRESHLSLYSRHTARFVGSLQVWLCNSQLSVLIILLESKRCSLALTELRLSSGQDSRSEWKQQIEERLTAVEDRVSLKSAINVDFKISKDIHWQLLNHWSSHNQQVQCTHERRDLVTFAAPSPS